MTNPESFTTKINISNELQTIPISTLDVGPLPNQNFLFVEKEVDVSSLKTQIELLHDNLRLEHSNKEEKMINYAIQMVLILP